MTPRRRGTGPRRGSDLRRKALRAGSYRLRITATDAAGNRSLARTATFRIRR